MKVRVLVWMAGAASLAVGLPSAVAGARPYASPALPGDPLWVSRFSSPGYGIDGADALGVSPDGSRVFVTGGSLGSGNVDYATVAYDAASGARLWARRYNGPGNDWDHTNALGVSPDGSRLFVTGESGGSGGSSDFATVAYDAASGARLWASRYSAGDGDDDALALGVSPDGSKVFVTGDSQRSGILTDYATVAYDAASGAQLWARRYNGPGNLFDGAYALGVSPDGSRVFVTGSSYGSGDQEDYATVAYDAARGAQLWVSRYDGPGSDDDFALALEVSPDGSRLFVTGESAGAGSYGDYATFAYDAASGAQLWEGRYNGPGNGYDSGEALGVSPDGSRLFVTGWSVGSGGYSDYATVAYDATSGAQRWARRYNGPGHRYDEARALRVSPDGSTLFVTGDSVGSGTYSDYATVAYKAPGGSQLWASRYNGPGSGGDEPLALGVSPDGLRLFVAGSSEGSGSSLDFATVAYSTG